MSWFTGSLMSLFVVAVTGENSAPARPPAVVTAPPADQVTLGIEGSAFPVAICPTPLAAVASPRPTSCGLGVDSDEFIAKNRGGADGRWRKGTCATRRQHR